MMWSRISWLLAITCLTITVPYSRAGRTYAETAEKSGEVVAAPDLAALLQAIHSDNFSQREKATDAMLRLPTDDRTKIENALATETDAEAISRLTKVAVHLFLKDPRWTPLHGAAGLLGIALTAEPIGEAAPADGSGEWTGQTAIVVLETKPGFPAYEVLRPGDRIVLLDDEPMDARLTVDTFRGEVSRKNPGGILNMTILRDGKKLRVAVRVAGLPQRGEESLVSFVERRALLAKNYVAHLVSGPKPAALVIPDNTPADIQLQNDYELVVP